MTCLLCFRGLIYYPLFLSLLPLTTHPILIVNRGFQLLLGIFLGLSFFLGIDLRRLGGEQRRRSALWVGLNLHHAIASMPVDIRLSTRSGGPTCANVEKCAFILCSRVLMGVSALVEGFLRWLVDWVYLLDVTLIYLSRQIHDLIVLTRVHSLVLLFFDRVAMKSLRIGSPIGRGLTPTELNLHLFAF